MIELEKKENGSGRIRTLAEVVSKDYFATHKLIREIFITDFDRPKFDQEIIKSYEWLKVVPQKVSILVARGVPDYVRDNQLTLGLFIELEKEIEEHPELAKIPVAYPLTSRELRADLEAIKNSDFYQEFYEKEENQDLLSFVVFSKYWKELKGRAVLAFLPHLSLQHRNGGNGVGFIGESH